MPQGSGHPQGNGLSACRVHQGWMCFAQGQTYSLFLQVVPRRCQDVGTTERGVYDHRFQDAHHAVVAGRETRAVDAGKRETEFSTRYNQRHEEDKKHLQVY